ncbi:MAG: hypothetical protein JNL66_13260, partial [Alphaproteobacteria bacterium]|nr:hypothetical protein [Alphaproteobacteria bacterium]
MIAASLAGGDAIAQSSEARATPAAFAASDAPGRINRACGDDPACRQRSDNRNFFDVTRVSGRVVAADCDRRAFVRRHGHEPCPNDMAWVCSANWQINVCIDRDLRREANGRFMGSVGRQQCQAWCEARGRR